MTEESKTFSVDIFHPIVKLRVQCAGPHFIRYWNKIHHDTDGNLSSGSSIDKISADETEFDIDVDYLRSLDPKEWKDQDHYRVLGIQNLRFNATDDDIKRAYRKIVLKHHPDKRKCQGEVISEDDDYFTCITKAYETLGNQTKRRSYDSIDPQFDDSLPTSIEIKHFFETFAKYFALNARWSERKNVPHIGDKKSTRAHVDHFYNFWYDFESWREFSYLDEEDKDKGQDREERRWIEKQNKTVRIKRKKEEMTRIRALVDLAYNNDPRIVQFKLLEKQKKQAAKLAKMSAAQAQRAEEERMLREAQAAKKEAEQAEQKRIEQIRYEKEQQKRVLKKERKTFRDLAKDNDYYSTSEKEKIKNMEGIEKICEMLKIMELQTFNKDLAAGGRPVFIKVLKETEQKLEEERMALFGTFNKTQTAANDAKTSTSAVKQVDRNAMWSPDNVQFLIKAVNLFPAGTVQRWETIASYLNQHCTNLGTSKFMARDVLNKAKGMQASDFKQKSDANENAFASFEKSKKKLKKLDNAEVSVNDNEPVVVQNGITVNGHAEEEIKTNGVAHNDTTESNGQTAGQTVGQPAQPPQPQQQSANTTWTKDEQTLLEQAMKTYPVSTADRWDRIAECIPNRTKKDCLRRVKELVDLVNAKREAKKMVDKKAT